MYVYISFEKLYSFLKIINKCIYVNTVLYISAHNTGILAFIFQH